MPKMKSHKGLLKRVKVTARGKVKFKHAGGSHLRSNKNGARIRKLRQMGVAKAGDLPLLERLLQRKLTPAGK